MPFIPLAPSSGSGTSVTRSKWADMGWRPLWHPLSWGALRSCAEREDQLAKRKGVAFTVMLDLFYIWKREKIF